MYTSCILSWATQLQKWLPTFQLNSNNAFCPKHAWRCIVPWIGTLCFQRSLRPGDLVPVNMLIMKSRNWWWDDSATVSLFNGGSPAEMFQKDDDDNNRRFLNPDVHYTVHESPSAISQNLLSMKSTILYVVTPCCSVDGGPLPCYAALQRFIVISPCWSWCAVHYDLQLVYVMLECSEMSSYEMVSGIGGRLITEFCLSKCWYRSR